MGREGCLSWYKLKVPCLAATNDPLWVDLPCSGTCESFDKEFRRFDDRKLEVESHRRRAPLIVSNETPPKSVELTEKNSK